MHTMIKSVSTTEWFGCFCVVFIGRVTGLRYFS